MSMSVRRASGPVVRMPAVPTLMEALCASVMMVMKEMAFLAKVGE